MRLLPVLMLFVVLCLNRTGAAGQKFFLQGIVKDSVQNTGLRSASIRNVFTGTTVVSRTDGKFIIAVEKGNILAVGASGYLSDTLTITDSILSSGFIVMQLHVLPATLPGVTVSAKLSPYQIDSIYRRKAFLATIGEVRITTVSRTNELGFGVGINIDRFSKREKNKRTARTLFDITEEEAYINFRWNENIVNKYTKFTGDTLVEFMQANRPTWEWLRKHPLEEDVLYYINQRLKSYFKRNDN